MKKIIFIFLFFISANFIYSQGTNFTPSGKVWGLVFGDYFYKVSGDSTSSTTEYSRFREDFNSFEFRRVFLGFDYNISEKFTANFVASYEGDLTTNTHRTFLLKDASLTWKNIFERTDLAVGLISPPAFSISEKVWGYRAIEKTIMDMRGIVSSRDIGVSMRGFFDPAKNIGYNFMIGNGRGTRLENNKYKKFYGFLNTHLMDRKIVIDAYADYEPIASEQNKTTFKGFLGYQTDKFSAGVEVFQHTHKLNVGINPTEIKPFGISTFINGEIIKDRLRFFGRFDHYDPDSEIDIGYTENFITAGLDIMPDKNVHFMPNIWINMFNKKSGNPLIGFPLPELKSDVVARLTFWYVYR